MDCGRKEIYHARCMNYAPANDRCYLVHGRTTHINKNMPLSVDLLYKGYQGSFLGVERLGRDVEHRLHPTPRLRMTVARKGTPLPSPLSADAVSFPSTTVHGSNAIRYSLLSNFPT
jgi:hypothetical protein